MHRHVICGHSLSFCCWYVCETARIRSICDVYCMIELNVKRYMNISLSCLGILYPHSRSILVSFSPSQLQKLPNPLGLAPHAPYVTITFFSDSFALHRGFVCLRSG